MWGWRLNIFIMSGFFSTPKSISVLLLTKRNHLAVDVYKKIYEDLPFLMLLTGITIFFLQWQWGELHLIKIMQNSENFGGFAQ